MSIKKPVLGIALFCLACLVVILLITPLFLPGTVIDAVDGEAQVHIETDRTWVAFPWSCYEVSWAVFHTTSVYLDGGGVIGEYTRSECVEWRNAPSFQRDHIYTINKADGTSRDFPFTQYVLVGRAEFWLGLILIAILLVASDRLGGSPRKWKWLRRGLLALPNTRVSLMPERIRTPRQKAFVAFALVVIFAAGLLLRLNFIYMFGKNDYQAWSYNNYYGGLTYAYIMISGIRGVEIPAHYNNLYPIGYPAMLSILHTFGFDYTGIRIVQAVVDTLTIIPIFLVLWRVRLSLWASLLGALAYALYPILGLGSMLMLAEWITSPIVIWVLYALLVASDSKQSWRWMIPGLLLGFMSLFRSEALLIVGVAGLWLLAQRWSIRRTVIAGVAMGIGFGIFTGLAGLNNLRTTGHFSVASNAGGYGLWSGLGILPNNYGYFVSDIRARDLLATMGMAANTAESSQYFMGEYIEAWRERPLYVLSTIGFRWSKILSQQDVVVLSLTTYGSYGAWHDFVTDVQPYSFTLLLVAAVLSYRNKRRLFALFFPMLAALLTIGIVYYEARYVRYTTVSYLIAAVMTLDWLVKHLRQALYYGYPRWQRTISTIFAALVVVIAAYFVAIQLPLLTSQIAVAQEVETASAVFTTQNGAPDYDMASLSWYTASDNVRFVPDEGWIVAPNLSGGVGMLETTIPLQGQHTVSVRMNVDLIAGSAYVALINNSERAQALILDLGEQTVELTAYVEDVDALLIRVTSYDYVAGSEIHVKSIDVYTTP